MMANDDKLIGLKFMRLGMLALAVGMFLGVIGGFQFVFPEFLRELLFTKTRPLHVSLVVSWIFLIAIGGIYFYLQFGGREYFEYPAVLSIPIFITWILFGVNYFRTIIKSKGPWPVYYWMWATGIIFFFITFCEAYLWLIPYFRESMIREIIVQWKSYGALTGSWNMLVYGTAIYVASRIAGGEETGHITPISCHRRPGFASSPTWSA
jgi:nitric oxide reductase subunit B